MHEAVVEGDLVVFLRYAREAGSGLANVHEAVVEHLDKNPRALADRALDTPLHFLVAFLRYAREAGSGLGNVHKAVVEHLDKNPRALADRALGKPLGSLAAFLRYAREAGSGLAEVAKAVESQVCVQTLSRAAAEATLNELSGFLSTSWIGANVVAAIDADRWQESRANLDDEPLSTLCAAIVRLVGSGRPTLAVPLALEATALSRLPEWREGYRLHGLGYTVSVLTEEHSCRLHRFLDMLCDGQWPASQMHQASTGSLTGTLFSLWPRLEQSQLKRFECRLGDIAFARRHHRLHNIESIRRGLCLIGTASLFHTRVPDDVAKLYGRKQVAPLICVTQPQSPRVDITGQEVQLWLGLRAISTYLQTSIAVPSTLGEAALKRWRASCPKLQKHTALNEVMIAWLRRCSAVGWNLIADTVPLPE